jgi:hypothetical protein
MSTPQAPQGSGGSAITPSATRIAQQNSASAAQN